MMVTTDGEIDDKSSFVRFLLYTSDFDVEGIVATNSKWQKSGHGLGWLSEAINLYEKVRPNLILHNPAYPTAAYLRSKLVLGNQDSLFLTGKPPYKDSPGSKLIVACLLKPDKRPLHVNCWGGANTVAQALWRLKQDYPTAVYLQAVAKIRIYAISFQDEAGSWIRRELREAMIIRARSWYQTWNYHPQKKNPYPQYMSAAWLAQNIKQGHSALGAWYPQQVVSEGDTPAFLPLVNNGLRAHEDYSWGGWGGRFRQKGSNYWEDAPDEGDDKRAITRWIPAVQNDFAARMDWTVQPFAKANHPPVVKVTMPLLQQVTKGQTIVLNAKGTYDRDKNELTYRWWHYTGPGNQTQTLEISNAGKQQASVTLPANAAGSYHIILEVTDNGTPALTSYQRIILQVKG